MWRLYLTYTITLCTYATVYDNIYMRILFSVYWHIATSGVCGSVVLHEIVLLACLLVCVEVNRSFQKDATLNLCLLQKQVARSNHMYITDCKLKTKGKSCYSMCHVENLYAIVDVFIREDYIAIFGTFTLYLTCSGCSWADISHLKQADWKLWYFFQRLLNWWGYVADWIFLCLSHQLYAFVAPDLALDTLGFLLRLTSGVPI